ncbi:MAG: HD domain-containing protein [Spirochaetes bacterium]|nr:HD domain-containing protein [Spirochaetota bacterium]
MSEKIKECVDLSVLLQTTERLNHVKDIDSLLDNFLFEARKFSNADAGSIFLTEGNNLTFSYVQNDTKAKRDPNSNKELYQKFTIPIDEQSISGYVALTGEPLNIEDVYKLPRNVPYKFNKNIDKKSDYHTQSVLTVPLTTSAGNINGVMQIINSKDENDNIRPFGEEHKLYVNFFASNASIAIERARMTRQTILRMVKMAELRDPKETGSHVNRVGSYSIEIYEKWAKNHSKTEVDIKHFKDNLKIATMLHDVGKVAIPDVILKKPAKLDDDEYKVMKTHAFQGAKLFDQDFSELDHLCFDVAYTHHERYDGTGYPRGLKGEEIPLAGRICAIADVYDALICKRVYKEPWTEDDVLKTIQQESGKHFDPQIVSIFMEIYEVIRAIKDRFPEAE